MFLGLRSHEDCGLWSEAGCSWKCIHACWLCFISSFVKHQNGDRRHILS